MNSGPAFELKDKAFQDLIRSLKNPPKVRVGVLGQSNRDPVPSEISHEDLLKPRKAPGTMTNAEVGAAHEFGTSKLPIRSFLRMPITENLDKYLEKSGAFNDSVLEQVIRSKSLMAWMGKVGQVARAIVADAFDTGGFGKWKPSNMRYKKNHQTLVETQQLRNSVTYEVVE